MEVVTINLMMSTNLCDWEKGKKKYIVKKIFECVISNIMPLSLKSTLSLENVIYSPSL